MPCSGHRHVDRPGLAAVLTISLYSDEYNETDGQGVSVRFMLAFAAASACLPALCTRRPGIDGARASLDASDASVLEGVIVTARRREENLQSVPAAVSVVNGDLLDSSYTVNTQQLSQLVPSLYYNSANPRNTAYTIRGLGSNTLSISAANDGIEPGVGFYVDQVYHGRPATASFDFTDIERVEVLRGPQGTLFGKNTTAGAIHVISREPSFEPEATPRFLSATTTSSRRRAPSPGRCSAMSSPAASRRRSPSAMALLTQRQTPARSSTNSTTTPCADSCCSCRPRMSSCA